MPKLTDAIVRDIKPPEGPVAAILWDSMTRGLGIKVTKDGCRSYVFRYVVRDSGRQRQITVGRARVGQQGEWDVAAARSRARELRRQVDAGHDPMGELRKSREAETVDELCDRYLAEHAPKKRESTVREDKSLLDQWIRPELGKLKVRGITRTDIEALHKKITDAGTPSRANRFLSLASKMFSLSVGWKMRADKPCKGDERNREYKRVRYLSGDELASLLRALAKRPGDGAQVVRLLLLTGARRGEVLGLKWADLDLKAGTWTKPPSSTKQREWHHVPLNAAAQQLLCERRAEAADGEKRAETLERAAPKQRHTKRRQIMLNAAARARLLASSPLVFPGPRRGKDDMPLETIRTLWRQVCEEAGIENLRLHDLRHSYASFLVGSGLSLPIVGALLGHAMASTTERYSHLALDPLRQATERVGKLVAAAESGKTAKVVKLTRRV